MILGFAGAFSLGVPSVFAQNRTPINAIPYDQVGAPQELPKKAVFRKAPYTLRSEPKGRSILLAQAETQRPQTTLTLQDEFAPIGKIPLEDDPYGPDTTSGSQPIDELQPLGDPGMSELIEDPFATGIAQPATGEGTGVSTQVAPAQDASTQGAPSQGVLSQTTLPRSTPKAGVSVPATSQRPRSSAPTSVPPSRDDSRFILEDEPDLDRLDPGKGDYSELEEAIRNDPDLQDLGPRKTDESEQSKPSQQSQQTQPRQQRQPAPPPVVETEPDWQASSEQEPSVRQPGTQQSLPLQPPVERESKTAVPPTTSPKPSRQLASPPSYIPSRPLPVETKDDETLSSEEGDVEYLEEPDYIYPEGPDTIDESEDYDEMGILVAPQAAYRPKRTTGLCDSSCTIGPPINFADGYDCGSEFGNFCNFGNLFIEDPQAPFLQLGPLGGTDFLGYPRFDSYPERPFGWLFDNMTLFLGGTGFGNRYDPIDERSFGIQEGINWAGRISPRLGISAQFGIRAIQRTIDGYNPAFSDPDWSSTGKGQSYITIGLFKRSRCNPLQFGAVYDWMSDSKYDGSEFDKKIQFGQIRTEVSYRTNYGCTFGFRGAFGTNDSDPFENELYKIRAVDQYLVFLETPFFCGSYAGFNAGVSGTGEAILGALWEQPLHEKFSLRTDFAYMIARGDKDDSPTVSDRREDWGVSFSLVFYPHGGAGSKACNPLRAMFEVADNTSMFPAWSER